MHLQLADRLEIGKPRRTSEGYLAVRARAARSGVYDYLGREIDPEGKHFAADQTVKVYRPEAEVFAKDAVHSFLMKPITDDHPSVAVTADNWRQHAKGVNAGAMRDGEYLAFDLLIMDKATIEAVDSGKRELSNGYGCELEIADGTAPDGTAYQAIQRSIRGNHVAVVDKARAGSECRISDGGNKLFGNCDAAPIVLDALAPRETTKMPHTLIIDGLQVADVSDQAKAAIEKLQGQLGDAQAKVTAAETQVATLTTDKATLEAKVTTLEQQAKDAAITPAKLRDAAKAYAGVVARAKALGVAVTDEMDEAAIMKAVVAAKIGDAAKDWNDVQVAASFATLAKDVKVEAKDGDIVPIHSAVVANDGADQEVKDAYEAMVADLTGAKKDKAAA